MTNPKIYKIPKQHLKTDRNLFSPSGSLRPFSVTNIKSMNETMDPISPNTELVRDFLTKADKEWMLATTRPTGPEGSSMVRTR